MMCEITITTKDRKESFTFWTRNHNDYIAYLLNKPYRDDNDDILHFDLITEISIKPNVTREPGVPVWINKIGHWIHYEDARSSFKIPVPPSGGW
jgi:hypothetical protein